MTPIDLQTIAAFGGAAAAIIYTVVTYFILRTTSENTKATRDIFEAAHRPYISPTTATITSPVHGEFEVTVVVINSGSVPAQDVGMSMSSRRDPMGSVPASILHEFTEAITLFPGEPYSFTAPLPGGYKPGLELFCEIGYHGIGARSYRTETTYRYYNLKGFAKVSGRMS